MNGLDACGVIYVLLSSYLLCVCGVEGFGRENPRGLRGHRLYAKTE